jgi:magnesium transporter
MAGDQPPVTEDTGSQDGAPVAGAPARPAQPPSPRVWVRQPGWDGLREGVPLDELRPLLTEPGAMVWIDLTAPHPAALERLADVCHLHPLAIEDARQPHNRPKIDEYAHFYFVVFYVALFHAPTSSLALHEVDLFVGERFVITVHRWPLAQIDEAVRRWAHNADTLGHDVGALLYALLDSMVDTYFPVLDALSERVDDVQEAIFLHPDRATLRELSGLRRTLLQLRRVVAPEREVMNTLLRRERPVLPTSAQAYFYDVYDHIVRVLDAIDTHREVLGSATDSYLSLTSNNLNQIMKVLTSWSIILMSVSVIAGVYGMNFTRMPELDWTFGYAFALGLMLLVGGSLFIYFRRRDWL